MRALFLSSQNISDHPSSLLRVVIFCIFFALAALCLHTCWTTHGYGTLLL